MDPAEIEKRLRLGEDARTEFKSVVMSGFLADPDDVARTVVAFLNSGGGAIFFGVEDDGTVTGCGDAQQVDALMRQVGSACLDSVEPPAIPRLVKEEFQGERLLVAEVPGFSPQRPYRFKRDREFYIRSGSRTAPAPRETWLRILQSSSPPFDEEPVTGSTVQDLDPLLVRKLLETQRRGTEEAPRHLRSLRCLDEGDVPTVGGMLLLGADPQRWFPDARVSVVRFPGRDLSLEFSDRKEIRGNLPGQIEEAISFAKVHLPAPSRIEGRERKELGIPDLAVEEILTNALIHRDYRAASQVNVFVFDDRIEVVNPGDLLNRLTIDLLRAGGISQRRNPLIAGLFPLLSRREHLGIGIPRVFSVMRERGLPEPEFQVGGGFFRVTLRSGGGQAA